MTIRLELQVNMTAGGAADRRVVIERREFARPMVFVTVLSVECFPHNMMNDIVQAAGRRYATEEAQRIFGRSRCCSSRLALDRLLKYRSLPKYCKLFLGQP